MSTERRSSSPSSSGLTLLEVMISVAMLGVVTSGILGLTFRSQIFVLEQRLATLVEQSGRRALERMAEELRPAASRSLSPIVPVNSPSVSFQVALDEVLLGPSTSFLHELAPGEARNGLDDNGDGRADEGWLTLTRVGEPPVRLAGNVVALRFTSVPKGVNATLVVEVIDRDGTLVSRTFERRITFRN